MIPDDLIFLGRRDDIPAILRQVQMFALTSDHEGFANVLLEAMAARLPVIATPAGDSGRLVQDGVTGYVLPHDDIAGMAERMRVLAQSEGLRIQMGQEGRRLVEHHYATDGLAAKLLAIYQLMAERCHSNRLRDALCRS